MTRQQKIEVMLWRARQLAGLGYNPEIIETSLVADGFPEATEVIRQTDFERELKQTAERVLTKRHAAHI